MISLRPDAVIECEDGRAALVMSAVGASARVHARDVAQLDVPAARAIVAQEVERAVVGDGDETRRCA